MWSTSLHKLAVPVLMMVFCVQPRGLIDLLKQSQVSIRINLAS